MIDAPIKQPTCEPKVIRQHIVDQLQAWEDGTLELANSGISPDEVILMRRSLLRMEKALRG